jgi:glycosyltransferase involved in cell wall biosynthesis
MACGCAVVTSQNGGCDEYAVDGFNCLVYPPTDHVGLTKQAEKLMSDADLRQKLAGGGLSTSARFTWEASAQALSAFLEGLC